MRIYRSVCIVAVFAAGIHAGYDVIAMEMQPDLVALVRASVSLSGKRDKLLMLGGHFVSNIDGQRFYFNTPDYTNENTEEMNSVVIAGSPLAEHETSVLPHQRIVRGMRLAPMLRRG